MKGALGGAAQQPVGGGSKPEKAEEWYGCGLDRSRRRARIEHRAKLVGKNILQDRRVRLCVRTSLRAVDHAIEEQSEISASVHLAVPDAITPLAVLNFCRASFEEGIEPFFGAGIALRNARHQGFKKIAGRRPALGNARQRLQQGEIS